MQHSGLVLVVVTYMGSCRTLVDIGFPKDTAGEVSSGTVVAQVVHEPRAAAEIGGRTIGSRLKPCE